MPSIYCNADTLKEEKKERKFTGFNSAKILGDCTVVCSLLHVIFYHVCFFTGWLVCTLHCSLVFDLSLTSFTRLRSWLESDFSLFI